MCQHLTTIQYTAVVYYLPVGETNTGEELSVTNGLSNMLNTATRIKIRWLPWRGYSSEIQEYDSGRDVSVKIGRWVRLLWFPCNYRVSAIISKLETITARPSEYVMCPTSHTERVRFQHALFTCVKRLCTLLSLIRPLKRSVVTDLRIHLGK